tara:strand:+ start:56 stop:577 length:522 start_codon:yes stop_codon:yes gene_type:complete
MKKIYKALADFQNEVPVIHEDTQGYNYTYANLNKIFETIKPLLKTHGLSFTQLLDGKNLKTVLFHIESGETLEGSVEIETDVKLASMNHYQIFGSAITYFRRYSLSCMLGLITDKDIDSKGERVEKETVKPLNKFIEGGFVNALKGTKAQIQMVLMTYDVTPDQRKQLTAKLK